VALEEQSLDAGLCYRCPAEIKNLHVSTTSVRNDFGSLIPQGAPGNVKVLKGVAELVQAHYWGGRGGQKKLSRDVKGNRKKKKKRYQRGLG